MLCCYHDRKIQLEKLDVVSILQEYKHLTKDRSTSTSSQGSYSDCIYLWQLGRYEWCTCSESYCLKSLRSEMSICQCMCIFPDIPLLSPYSTLLHHYSCLCWLGARRSHPFIPDHRDAATSESLPRGKDVTPRHVPVRTNFFTVWFFVTPRHVPVRTNFFTVWFFVPCFVQKFVCSSSATVTQRRPGWQRWLKDLPTEACTQLTSCQTGLNSWFRVFQLFVHLTEVKHGRKRSHDFWKFEGPVLNCRVGTPFLEIWGSGTKL
jgi:hypothetical protein